TSNNDQIGNTLDNDPLNDDVYLTFATAEGFRQARILEMLTNSTGLEREPGAKISFADMSRYQYDFKSKEAERLVPILLAAAEARPDLVDEEMASALDRLREWGVAKPGSPAYDTLSGIDASELRDDVPPRETQVSDEERADAVATSIFAGWQTRLGRLVFADDFSGTGVGAPGGDDAVKALLHIIEDIDRTDPGFVVHTKGDNGESTLWDDKRTAPIETKDEILVTALRQGLTFLTERFASADQSTWLWGMIHQVNFQHFFGQAGIGAYDLGPFAAPGARSTVSPAGYSLNSNSFIFSSGPSKRFVAVLDPAGIRAVNSLPGGANGNPGRLPGQPPSVLFNRINPEIHYGDHIPGWINGEVFEYRITRSDVEANAERTFSFVPPAAD
ncbi:MAG TPA: penicillin acylase family protein, partial [Terriglobales bacterium]|nr:penicillin acylase family protein [Terriglobales bacterium]